MQFGRFSGFAVQQRQAQARAQVVRGPSPQFGLLYDARLVKQPELRADGAGATTPIAIVCDNYSPHGRATAQIAKAGIGYL
ncbi:hypothetical protein GCM10022255_100820 [Dactylosporangium darangshiense]|uniref:Uncharacterized protein n=1 Tax=Dactylosporangium darangshiense TaxID=579108 RepID=A0ABP8DRU0_9ACTN